MMSARTRNRLKISSMSMSGIGGEAPSKGPCHHGSRQQTRWGLAVVLKEGRLHADVGLVCRSIGHQTAGGGTLAQFGNPGRGVMIWGNKEGALVAAI